MKRRSILLSVFGGMLALSMSAFAITGIPKKAATAETNAQNYWKTIFDVESTGEVTFTSQADAPAYTPNGVQTRPFGGVASTNVKENVGLGVTVTAATTLTYKKLVYIDNLTMNDSLIEFFIAPASMGGSETAYEIGAATLRLEDYENSNKFIEMKLFASSYDKGLSWAIARTDTISWGGWHSKNSMIMDASRGTPVSASFTGSSQNSGTIFRTMAFMWDAEENAVLVNPSLYPETALPYTSYGTVRDLDNAAHMTGSDTLFKGFDSKYVRLSVTFDDVIKDSGNVILLSLLGQSLNGEQILDKTAPKLTLTNALDADNLPKGEKGTYYPFGEIEAFDVVEGILNDEIAYTVVDPDGTTVVNGEKYIKGFTPVKEGVYTITANVADSANNVSAPLTLNVEVLPIVEELVFALNGTIKPNASIGETITLPKYAVTGGSGTVDVERRVFYANKTKEVEVINDEFMVEVAGRYCVSYRVKDYLGTDKEYTYYILATVSKEPIIENAFLPKAVKANNKLYINVPAAYDYASVPGSKTEVPVTTLVSEDGTFTDGKAVTEANGEIYYTPSDSASKVYIKYVATNKLGGYETESEVYEVEIVKLTSYSDLFYKYGGNTDIDFRKPNIYVDDKEAYFNPTEQGASLQFINAIGASSFSLRLNIDKDKTNFKSIAVRLTDSKNVNEAVTIRIQAYSNDKSLVTTNFTTGKTGSSIYHSSTDSEIYLKLKLGRYIYDGNQLLLAELLKYDNGSEYLGFTSGSCYVDVIFEEFDYNPETETYAEVRFTDFVGQPKVTEKNPALDDSIAPIITLSEHIHTFNSFNSEVIIPSATATDMVSPECKVYVSVKDPDGTYIIGSAQSGVEANKDYRIKLTKYGTYVVMYRSKDERGAKEARLTFNVKSVDLIDPVLEIKGQVKTQYKVGDKLVLPEYKVTDNNTKEEDMTVYVYLTTPSFGFKTVGVKGVSFGYTFVVAGDYRLTFYVRDGSGNYVIKNYDFTVKEA